MEDPKFSGSTPILWIKPLKKIADEGLRFSHSAECDRGTPGEGDDTYEAI
jgi:hypothetical protein